MKEELSTEEHLEMLQSEKLNDLNKIAVYEAVKRIGYSEDEIQDFYGITKEDVEALKAKHNMQ